MFFVARLALLTVALLLCSVDVEASYCPKRLLPQMYESAAVVFIAKTGEQSEVYAESGETRCVWTFETSEIFKGEITFDVLESEIGMCRVFVGERYEFLIFTDSSGGIHTCNAALLAGSAKNHPWLAVLREFKSGMISSVTEPWIYYEAPGLCLLSHKIVDGGGRLEFYYRFADAYITDGDHRQYPYPEGLTLGAVIGDAGPHPSHFAGFMNLRVIFPAGRYVAEGTGRLLIGDKIWATKRTNMEAPYAGGYEFIEAAEANEVLAELESGASIKLQASLTNLPSYDQKQYPQYPLLEAETPLVFLDDSLEKFRICLSGGNL